ncbi:MAG: TIGR03936 family radical SAM-associated protein [Candidatus Promineifilaceae bacterium]|nr:TIGR03936 family radical SAM-associated protein [Candidatus Promineifilaceae bacterium]
MKFSKIGPTRYISHLDLARALERALNRARVPVSYTQGYNPRPRMQFASALPLGFTSEAELADVWLEEEMVPAEAREQIMSRMAPGIVVHEVWEVPLDAPAMQASTLETAYVAQVDDVIDLGEDSIDRAELRQRVEGLLAAESVMRERRGKEYDLRPLVLELDLEEDETGVLLLTMRLLLQPGKTGRPDEVLDALGLDPLSVRVHRTKIVLEDGAEGTVG